MWSSHSGAAVDSIFWDVTPCRWMTGSDVSKQRGVWGYRQSQRTVKEQPEGFHRATIWPVFLFLGEDTKWWRDSVPTFRYFYSFSYWAATDRADLGHSDVSPVLPIMDYINQKMSFTCPDVVSFSTLAFSTCSFQTRNKTYTPITLLTYLLHGAESFLRS